MAIDTRKRQDRPRAKPHPKAERAMPAGPKSESTKLITAEVQAKIIAFVKLGAPRDAACPAAGIDARTLRRWCEWGREGRAEYTRFVEMLEQAEAQAEVMYASIIAKAAQADDWKAAAFWLRNRPRDRWHESQPVPQSVTAAPPQVTLTIKRAAGPARQVPDEDYDDE